MGTQEDRSGSLHAGRFDTTQWSLVLAAGEERSGAEHALTQLCQIYWYPLYAYVRRKGYQPAEAQDLTQGFFACLLEKNFLASVNPQRGRFRTFLMVALQHYIADVKRYESAKKRGGGQFLFSLDLDKAEKSFLAEPEHSETAEILFDRQWAITLLEHVLNRLKQEYENSGKSQIFETLKDVLTSSGSSVRYRDLGNQLEMSESAVKVTVHRLRQRFREILEAEISQTLTNPDDIQEEIHSLFDSVRRN